MIGSVITRLMSRLAAAAICIVSGQALAGDPVSVQGGDCGSGTRLSAENARLSEIFKRLADELGFELRFVTDDDPVISIDATAPPVELMTGITGVDNLIVIEAPDPRCSGLARVTKIWVLGSGAGDAPTPQDTSELDAEQRAKRATDMYLRAHGMADDEESQ